MNSYLLLIIIHIIFSQEEQKSTSVSINRRYNPHNLTINSAKPRRYPQVATSRCASSMRHAREPRREWWGGDRSNSSPSAVIRLTTAKRARTARRIIPTPSRFRFISRVASGRVFKLVPVAFARTAVCVAPSRTHACIIRRSGSPAVSRSAHVNRPREPQSRVASRRVESSRVEFVSRVCSLRSASYRVVSLRRLCINTYTAYRVVKTFVCAEFLEKELIFRNKTRSKDRPAQKKEEQEEEDDDDDDERGRSRRSGSSVE